MREKARHIAILTLGWFGLFLAVVGVQLGLASNSRPVLAALPLDDGDHARSGDTASAVWAELRAQPLRSRPTSVTSIERFAKTHSAFFDSLNGTLIENRWRLSRCRDSAMARSARQIEAFEFSFILQPVPGGYRLTGFQLERGTMTLKAAEQQCVFEVLGEVVLPATDVPAGRILYPFCLNR